MSFFNRSEYATDERIINYRPFGAKASIFLLSITDDVVVFFGHGPLPYHMTLRISNKHILCRIEIKIHGNHYYI